MGLVDRLKWKYYSTDWDEVRDKAKKTGSNVLRAAYDKLEETVENNISSAQNAIQDRNFSDEQLERLADEHENDYIREAAKRELDER